MFKVRRWARVLTVYEPRAMKEDVSFIEFDCIECQVQVIISSKIYQAYGPKCEDCIDLVDRHTLKQGHIQ